MRKLITTLSFIFLLGMLTARAQCCGNHAAESKQSKTTAVKTNDASAVKAYYFHATRRCATCNAVEDVTKQTLKEYYGDKIAFSSINREEEKGNPLIAKYKISGQTLIIVKGDKVVNLTNEAFMNARTKPENLKAKIKSTVDGLMN